MLASIVLAMMLAFPSAPTGKCILDTTGAILDHEFAALETACEAVNKAGDGQIAVAVVNNLEGQSRLEYANGLFKAWGIGHKGKDDGLLVLLALPPADRGIKVEVGYGLEGRLNDGKVMAAVRERAMPDLKAGRYGTALLTLVKYYGAEMHVEHVERSQQVASSPPSRVSVEDDYAWGWLLLIGAPVFLGAALWLLTRKKKKPVRTYTPSYSPPARSYTPSYTARSSSSDSSSSSSSDNGSSWFSGGSSSSDSSSSSSSSDSGGGFGGFDSGSSGGGGGDSSF